MPKASKQVLIIKADTNDADYVTSETQINNKTVELIKPIIKAIKNFKPYTVERENGHKRTFTSNFPTNQCLRDDIGEKSSEEIYVESGLISQKVFDIFEGMIPYGENGIHTIVSIRLIQIISDEELLK